MEREIKILNGLVKEEKGKLAKEISWANLSLGQGPNLEKGQLKVRKSARKLVGVKG